MLRGRILITGGSGFLGRGILRRIRREKWPAAVTIYSRDETKQWEVKRRFPEVTCVLGDVRDYDRLETTMVGHDFVIHAGAVKYIPEAEQNVAETIDVNVEGSRRVAMAAVRVGVKAVVGVSTDKACSPLNTYGATKMLMERLFAEANEWSDTKFTTVRYGNVVGSTGSVIPIFLRQVEEFGEVRVTDPSMTRFWLSIDEAVDLIDKGLACEQPGSTLIQNCAAMTISDLAQAAWLLSGRSGPVKTYEIGVRPGEKIHESLYNVQEFPRINIYDEKDFILHPVLSKIDISLEPHPLEYSSDEPSRWLTVKEMVAMIKDAQEVWL